MSQKRLFFLLGLGLFIVFILFSYIIAKHQFTEHDFDYTVKLQDHIPRRLDLPFSMLSVLGSVEITMPLWLGLVVLALIKRYWATALNLFLLPLALFIEVYGKLFVFHPAPPYMFYRGVIDFHFPSQYIHTDYSYPSGHVTRTSFLIVFLILWLQFKIPFHYRSVFQIGLLIFLLAMMVSRVYLGEHWSSDVIGGLLIGSSFGIMAALTIPTKLKRGSLANPVAAD